MSDERRFSSVWDAIEDTVTEATSMRVRSRLMMAVQSWAKTQRTQAEAAHRLGVTQPRMSDLMRGKIHLFSVESLLDMAALAGLRPEVTVNVTTAAGQEQHELRAGASSSSVCEVPVKGEDGHFLVGAETSGATGTVGKTQLALVRRAT